MRLYLVQHGEAVAKEVDPARPLSERGLDDMIKMAGFLKRCGVHVSRVLHSGKRRAEQTAQVLAAAILAGEQPESAAGLNPNDDVASFAKRLTDFQADTLVAGHLPFMARLVTWLTTGNNARVTVAYKPGSVVCLQRQEDGSWILEWMLRPDLLGEASNGSRSHP